jgi:hypothetical protein
MGPSHAVCGEWITGVETAGVAVARANFPAAQAPPPQSSHDFKRKGDYNLATELYGFIREYMARIGAPLNLSNPAPEMNHHFVLLLRPVI